jgi:hypothetical protein
LTWLVVASKSYKPQFCSCRLHLGLKYSTQISTAMVVFVLIS